MNFAEKNPFDIGKYVAQVKFSLIFYIFINLIIQIQKVCF